MCDACDTTPAPTKLDPAVKADWVSALRSGEYSQAHGALQKGGGFCCLGVLCEVAVKAGIPLEIGRACDCGDDDCDGVSVTYNDSDAYPPEVVQDWAGMNQLDPYVIDKEGDRRTLSALNDGGSTFAEIADLIEEQL